MNKRTTREKAAKLRREGNSRQSIHLLESFLKTNGDDGDVLSDVAYDYEMVGEFDQAMRLYILLARKHQLVPHTPLARLVLETHNKSSVIPEPETDAELFAEELGESGSAEIATDFLCPIITLILDLEQEEEETLIQKSNDIAKAIYAVILFLEWRGEPVREAAIRTKPS